MVEEIFNNKGYKPEDLSSSKGQNLIEETYRILEEGVNKGITQEIDEDIVSALKENTFIFSGFKTHQELKEVSSMLINEDGSFKPFDQFKREVLVKNEEYNKRYLEAEYNYAVQSAQMASKWQQFVKDGDLFNLQYRTAGDERVREEHQALEGTTLPVSDNFWNNYLPPLGWNCRCTVVQVSKNRPVSNSEQAIKAGEMATSKPAQKIFRFNPGKELKIFPPKHPYFPKGCGDCQKNLGAKKLAYYPDSEWCRVCGSLNSCVAKYAKNEKIKGCEKPIEIQNEEAKVRIPKAEEGVGNYTKAAENEKLLINSECDKRELEANKRCALDILKAFPDLEIKIRPNIFAGYLPNPEYYIGKFLADRKGVTSEDGISAGFNKAIKQGSSIVVIDFDMKMSDCEIKWIDAGANLGNRFSDFMNGYITECYLIHKGRALLITAKDIVNDRRKSQQIATKLIKSFEL